MTQIDRGTHQYDGQDVYNDLEGKYDQAKDQLEELQDQKEQIQQNDQLSDGKKEKLLENVEEGIQSAKEALDFTTQGAKYDTTDGSTVGDADMGNIRSALNGAQSASRDVEMQLELATQNVGESPEVEPPGADSQFPGGGVKKVSGEEAANMEPPPMDGGNTFVTEGGFRVDHKGSTTKIYEKTDEGGWKEKNHIHGDPHVDDSGGSGDEFHFGDDSTLALPDGSEVRFNTEEVRDGVYVTKGVDILSGNDHAVSGMSEEGNQREGGVKHDRAQWEQNHDMAADAEHAGYFAMQEDGQWAKRGEDGQFRDVSEMGWGEYQKRGGDIETNGNPIKVTGPQARAANFDARGGEAVPDQGFDIGGGDFGIGGGVDLDDFMPNPITPGGPGGAGGDDGNLFQDLGNLVTSGLEAQGNAIQAGADALTMDFEGMNRNVDEMFQDLGTMGNEMLDIMDMQDTDFNPMDQLQF